MDGGGNLELAEKLQCKGNQYKISKSYPEQKKGRDKKRMSPRFPFLAAFQRRLDKSPELVKKNRAADNTSEHDECPPVGEKLARQLAALQHQINGFDTQHIVHYEICICGTQNDDINKKVAKNECNNDADSDAPQSLHNTPAKLFEVIQESHVFCSILRHLGGRWILGHRFSFFHKSSMLKTKITECVKVGIIPTIRNV